MRKQLLILFSIFFYISIVNVVYADTTKELFRKQIDFRADGFVSLTNTNGRIVVEGWDKNIVVIEAEKQAKASSKREAERLLKEIKVVISKQNNDEILIETHLPRKHKDGFFDWIFGHGGSGSVNYKLYVPNNTNLDVKTTNGRISVNKIFGKTNLRTTNGKIVGDELAGRVDARTTNGTIALHFDSILADNDMGFYTTNGSINITLPEKIQCNIKAKTTNGSLNTEFPLTVKGKYHSKRIEGEINGGGAILELVTTNGSIRINRNK
jgi:DUF4097 and DUF4098 domain-containing protein YvlB